MTERQRTLWWAIAAAGAVLTVGLLTLVLTDVLKEAGKIAGAGGAFVGLGVLMVGLYQATRPASDVSAPGGD